MSLSLSLVFVIVCILTPSYSLEILRKSQLQRLTHLIDRKKSIEADLVKHAGELQEAYERTKGEVQVVLEGRMTDLRGAEGYNRVKDAHSGKGKARAAE